MNLHDFLRKILACSESCYKVGLCEQFCDNWRVLFRMKIENLKILRIACIGMFVADLLCLTARAQEASVDETMRRLANQIDGSISDIAKLHVEITNDLNAIDSDATAAQAESEYLAKRSNEQTDPEIKSLQSSDAENCHSHSQHLMYINSQLLDMNDAAEFIVRSLRGERLVQPVVEALAGVTGSTAPTADQLAAAKEMLKLVSHDATVLTKRLADRSKQMEEQISKNRNLAEQAKKFLDGMTDSETPLGEAEKESAKGMSERLAVERRHLSDAAAIDSDLTKYGQIVNMIVKAQEIILGPAK
jgi:hypothetical protein